MCVVVADEQDDEMDPEKWFQWQVEKAARIIQRNCQNWLWKWYNK